MNEAIGKSGTIIFIIIALVLLTIAGTQLSQGALKVPLKFIDSWLGTTFVKDDQDLTTLNEKAKANFDKLISEINECSSSKNIECKCKTDLGFSDFNEIHEIQISNENIKLVSKQLTSASLDLNAPKCFISPNSINDLTPLITIKFDKDNPYLKDSNNNEDFLGKEILYKTQGKLCWLTNRDPLLIKSC